MSPNFNIKIRSLLKLKSSFEKKIEKIFKGGNWTERGRGNKRHGYNSNAIAKMKFLIVNLVIKVI
jgi:hypothetical protein